MQATPAADPDGGRSGEVPAPEASEAPLGDPGSGGARTEREGSAGSTGEPLRLARPHTKTAHHGCSHSSGCKYEGVLSASKVTGNPDITEAYSIAVFLWSFFLFPIFLYFAVSAEVFLPVLQSHSQPDL